MENAHVLVYYGTKRENWPNRPSLTDTFIDAHDKPAKVVKPNRAGIQFGVMGLEQRGDAIVFRVGNTTLNDACFLHLEMMPQGKPIGDELAGKILGDAIRMNPEQADELSEYHGTMTPKDVIDHMIRSGKDPKDAAAEQRDADVAERDTKWMACNVW